MKHQIDDIINNSETSKAVDLDPHLWERLERRLDFDKPTVSLGDRRRQRRKRSMFFSRIMVAASFVAVFTLISSLYLSTSKYQVTDLDTNARPYFTKDDIDVLKQYHPAIERVINDDSEVG